MFKLSDLKCWRQTKPGTWQARFDLWITERTLATPQAFEEVITAELMQIRQILLNDYANLVKDLRAQAKEEKK
jgi:hypothetical protein